MPTLFTISDPGYIQAQYHSAAKINTRIGLHERFSTNPYGWQRWIFAHLHLPQKARLLEVGCGTGALWAGNLERIPPGWKICLSDLSPGMLEQTGANLGKAASRFEYRQVDAREIPFPDGSFDAVIANHMLHHLEQPDLALGEMKRVLKDNGTLYASAVGRHNLFELREVLSHFSPSLNEWGVIPGASFTLENGALRLAQFFPHVQLECYEDALCVTEAKPLIDYICSGRANFSGEELQLFTQFIQKELEQRGGKMTISKDAGLFQARSEPGWQEQADS